MSPEEGEEQVQLELSKSKSYFSTAFLLPF